MMDLHPAIVHFPIGLLAVYSLLEVLSVKFDSEKWQFARSLILILGVLGGIAAYITGQLTGAEDEIAKMHELFGTLSMVVYLVLALAYSLKLKELRSLNTARDFIMKKPVRISLAVLGFILLSITGALGGIMVHGPINPFDEFLYALLF